MRKFFTILLLMSMAVLGYFGYAHYSGAAVPVWGLPLGGEKANVRSRVSIFFESLRFKNTQALKDFFAPDIQPQEIAHFLLQTFNTPVRDIDLQSAKIKDIELDSSKKRARVRIELSGQNLDDQKSLDISKIIFLYSEGESNKWLIDTADPASHP